MRLTQHQSRAKLEQTATSIHESDALLALDGKPTAKAQVRLVLSVPINL
jgi:hypothetical protein